MTSDWHSVRLPEIHHTKIDMSGLTPRSRPGGERLKRSWWLQWCLWVLVSAVGDDGVVVVAGVCVCVAVVGMVVVVVVIVVVVGVVVCFALS